MLEGENLVARRRMVTALGVAALGIALPKYFVPTKLLADTIGKLDIEADIPKVFGAWSEEPLRNQGIVSPEVQALIAAIYSQTLSRSYLHASDGYRIMLSVAYGGDQASVLQTHYPDICYPSQGFSIANSRVTLLELPNGKINVRRLETSLGISRREPVSYWAMVGDKQELSGFERRLVGLSFGLRGLIPDGLLFRVSSIDSDPINAFKRQDEFLTASYSAIAANRRVRYFSI
jgi:EpsI family protein